MKIPVELSSALQLLCGEAKFPTCLCDPWMQILWQSGSNVDSLCHALAQHLRHTNSAAPRLSGDHTVFFLHDESPWFCQVLSICVHQQPYFLLRFTTHMGGVSLTPTEIRSLLAEMSTELRDAAAKLTYAIESNPHAVTDSNAQQCIYRTIYRLLEQAARCNELHWYEKATPESLQAIPVCNLSELLIEILEDLRTVTAGIITIQTVSLPRKLWMQIDPKRFRFAFYTALVQLHEGNPDRTAFSCNATLEDHTICFTMQLTSLGKYEGERLHALGPDQHDTALSPQNLLTRFCNTFHVKALLQRQEDTQLYTFRIPLARPPYQYKVRAPHYEPANCYDLQHLLLSPILDFPPPPLG